MGAASPAAGAAGAAGANRALVKSYGSGATKLLPGAPPTQVLHQAPDTKVLGPDKAPATQKIDRGQPPAQDADKQKGKSDQEQEEEQEQGQEQAVKPDDKPKFFKNLRVQWPGIPDPGSITFPLLFLLLLLFFVQPVSGTKKTRAQWLWSVLTGPATLPLPGEGTWGQGQRGNSEGTWGQGQRGQG